MSTDTTQTSIDLIEITFNQNDPSVTIGWSWWFVGGILLLVVLWRFLGSILTRKIKDKFFVSKVKIKVKAGNVEFEEEIQRSFENLYIANRIYIELVTRKAAIPIDEEHDVIKEVYDSWFVLFTTIRNEIKSLPGEFLKNHNSSDKLIELTTDILNKGLRPHLTKYQARFRKWYQEQLADENNKGKHPQDIQKEFEKYDELIEDMKAVNGLLEQYKDELKKLIS